ncbi:MAG: hypothetical protein HC798_04605 [Polaribacter sp.]|nr:hypothetical protein [Polaribacter sp.]
MVLNVSILFYLLTGSWADTNNWSLALIPENTHEVVVPSGKTSTIQNTINAIKKLTNQGDVVIQPDFSLQVTTDLSNNGSIILNSNQTQSASLLVSGNYSGNLTYAKNVSANWELVAAPVIGETIQNIINNGNLASGTNGNLGFAPYNNSFILPATTGWQYVKASTTGTVLNGSGYSVKRNTSGNINFTGTFNASDTSISLIDGSQNMWNLIGNPYPSYIAGNDNANVSNILTSNIGALLSTHAALYFWNPSTQQYDIINNASFCQIYSSCN